MHIETAKNLHDIGELEEVQLHVSPTDVNLWVIFIKTKEGKSFFIIDEDESVCQMEIREAISKIKDIGFRSTEVFF